MRRFIGIIFILTLLLTIIIWGFSNFVQPLLPSGINNSFILFFLALISVVSFLANIKEIIEFFYILRNNAENLSLQFLPDQERRIREKLLTKVDKFWIKEVFDNSLREKVFLELSVEYRPESVDYPWEMILLRPKGEKGTKLTISNLLCIFNDVGCELLILGEPGAGKTTLLLHLAKQLIHRSRQDCNKPIPLVFNLISWKGGKSFHKWLLDEISLRYQLPKTISNSLLISGRLVLLLDGLDELKTKERKNCIEEINKFRTRHMIDMVVCSRVTEYDEMQTKLKLNNAIILNDLTLEQIDSYFLKLGDHYDHIRREVNTSPLLQELVRTPLNLNIITLTLLRNPLYNTPKSSEIDKRDLLFDIYIKTMLSHRLSKRVYSTQKTTKWISWLASKMMKNSFEFVSIKNIKASTFLDEDHANKYKLMSGLVTGLYCFLVLVGISVANQPIRSLLLGVLILILTAIIIRFIEENKFQYGTVYEPEFISAQVFKSQWKEFLNSLDNDELEEWLDSKNRKTIDDVVDEMWTISNTRGLFDPHGCFLVMSTFVVSALLENILFAFFLGVILKWAIGLPWYIAGFIGFITSISVWFLQFIFNRLIFPFGKLDIERLFGVVLGVVIGLFSMILTEVEIFGVLCGSMIILYFGALKTHIDNFLFRIILVAYDYFPWNYRRFLDSVVDLIFMRKTSKGYSFYHQTLMEYLADLHSKQIE